LSVEAAKQIIEKLDSQIVDRELGDPFFADPDVVAFPFATESFHQIRPIKDTDRRLAFVDGGNLEILGAPNFSVQLNRVYACVWKNNARQALLRTSKIEFYSAISSKLNNGEIEYETIIVPSKASDSILLPDPLDLTFNSFDKTITNGTQRADISRVASIARNFAEWKFAAMVSEALQEGDVLVMDGSLQTQFKNEWKYFRNLEDATQKQGVILSSLSKTSTLFTTTGLSLLGAISQFARNEGITGEWYHPVFESPKHHIFGHVVKLKSFSEWVFRLDIQRDQYLKLSDEELNEILSLFCSNSSDAAFPGYPYGCIDSDNFSRVSEEEVEYYRAVLISHISAMQKLEKFRFHIRAGDAHDMLNLLGT
jgi:NurA domain